MKVTVGIITFSFVVAAIVMITNGQDEEDANRIQLMPMGGSGYEFNGQGLESERGSMGGMGEGENGMIGMGEGENGMMGMGEEENERRFGGKK